MERSNKLGNAVGLAMKAGRLKSGDFTVEKLVRAGGVPLVLLDADASANTAEKYMHLCERMQTILLRVPALGTWIGKPERMVAAVTDENFTKMILRAAPETTADEGDQLRG